MSFVKKNTNLKQSSLSRQQCFEQTEQPVKMVLRFAQQQKIQFSEMREPYFFYAQSISKVFCAKHLHKIFDNNYATYSLAFTASQTIFTDFFGSLKTSEKLSFFKNQKDEKVPGFPFPSAIGGCPTTFSRLASVAGIGLSTLNQDKPKRGRTLLLTYKKSESKRPRQ